MRIPAVLITALLASSPLLADPIDEAEAKRRGVSVEMVQLETARARIATLEARVRVLENVVSELRAQNAKLSAASSKPVAATAPATAPDVIAQAVKEKRLVVGMTFAQMRDVSEVEPKLVSQGRGADYYQIFIQDGKDDSKGIFEYSVTVRQNAVVSWSNLGKTRKIILGPVKK